MSIVHQKKSSKHSASAMRDKSYVFLGGIFPETQLLFIQDNSLGNIQNAADAFQKKILIGLDSVLNNKVTILNLPFIGSYPKHFQHAFFPSCCLNFGSFSHLTGLSFCNIFGIRIVSRFISALTALLSLPTTREYVLIVYSAHLPFMLSALLFKIFRNSIQLCLILPDLPEHMGDNSGFRKILKWFDIKLFYLLSKHFDRYVLLSKHMAPKLNIQHNQFVVIEGIAQATNYVPYLSSSSKKSFLYTGTLAKRYGVMNLVSAFSKLRDDSIELWICGDGDAREEIALAAISDPRILFFGQVARELATDLQSKASFLVNPREPTGDFTKYSFPSKVLEYMVSGRPVIMYRLEGIPDEYDNLFITPTGQGVQELYECMSRALTLSDETLIEIGSSARKFVLTNKNPEIQARKIINLFEEE